MRLQIVRFLETFRWALSWIKTEVLLLFIFRIELLFIFSFITCHSRILQCVYRIQEFLLCAVCCSFSITCALSTAEYRLNFAFAFVFSLFTALYSHCHWKSELIWNMKEFSSILKQKDSPAFRSRFCLSFFQ